MLLLNAVQTEVVFTKINPIELENGNNDDFSSIQIIFNRNEKQNSRVDMAYNSKSQNAGH